MADTDIAGIQAQLAALAEENRLLGEALERVIDYNERLKRERDGSRAENAALKSKLADATTESNVGDAIAQALRKGRTPNLLARDRGRDLLAGDPERIEQVRKSLV